MDGGLTAHRPRPARGPSGHAGDHLGHRSTSATMTYTKVDLGALHEVGDFDLGELQ